MDAIRERLSNNRAYQGFAPHMQEHCQRMILYVQHVQILGPDYSYFKPGFDCMNVSVPEGESELGVLLDNRNPKNIALYRSILGGPSTIVKVEEDDADLDNEMDEEEEVEEQDTSAEQTDDKDKVSD